MVIRNNFVITAAAERKPKKLISMAMNSYIVGRSYLKALLTERQAARIISFGFTFQFPVSNVKIFAFYVYYFICSNGQKVSKNRF